MFYVVYNVNLCVVISCVCFRLLHFVILLSSEAGYSVEIAKSRLKARQNTLTVSTPDRSRSDDNS